MITSIISFLGGSVFRMLWGEISHWLTAKQEHAFEIERIKVQAGIDADQHARNMEAIRVQADLGVKTIAVQAEANISEIEAQGWLSAVNATSKPSGIAWIDGWNQIIRPFVATWSVVIITLGELAAITLSESTLAICSAALGIYLAERNLMKRGK